MLKSVVQILVIALAKTVGKHDDQTHLFLYTFLFIAYLLHGLKFKPFNYARLSMWHSVSLAGVLWLAFLNLLDHMTEEHIAYVVLLFVGWAVLIGVGWVVQQLRFPSMLVTV
jgi:hypothetical protein